MGETPPSKLIVLEVVLVLVLLVVGCPPVVIVLDLIYFQFLQIFFDRLNVFHDLSLSVLHKKGPVFAARKHRSLYPT